ncbi:MAG: Asp-tRNA(Asn)/Glu-tRNA(Gln) amidotransferase subunit GatC [Ruminococcus sp.]|jgi:aspartyl-tRNA(Asn)/glutamyl-tRNA(Gln) amidotransferase subunit C
MSRKIDDATMDNVEILAKLDLTPEEREKAREEMEKILTYVDKLKELDTDRIEPLVHILENGNVFREDTVINGDGREEALSNAPRKKDGQYMVPKTV